MSFNQSWKSRALRAQHLLGAAGIAVLVGTPPVAQAADELQEIVVTATRREESLQSVALAVTAVSAESLTARGINSLGDIQPGAVPGVIINQFAGNPSVLNISVRGIGISDPTQGTQELPVPLYIDGVFLGRAQGLGMDLIDPERVEILRGPQGQLFGRNAEGGVVQFVSRKPTGEFGVKGSASYGNYNDQRYRLAVDLPEVAGFSTLFTAIKSQHDGYTKNEPKGAYAEQKDFGFLDAWGARGAIRWKGNGLTADYAYDYAHDKDSQPYLTWAPYSVNTNGNILFAASKANAPSTDFPKGTVGPFYNPGFLVRSSGHALTLAYALSDDITLKSITAYRTANRQGGSNLGAALVAGIGISGAGANPVFTAALEGLDQNQTSQELQMIGSWNQFDVTAGLMYYNERVDDTRSPTLSGPGTTPPATNLSPAFCAGVDPCIIPGTHQTAKSDSYGVYSQATYRATDKLQLTAGIRYTDDKKKAKRDKSFVALNPPIDANFSAKRWDPAVSLKYQWTDALQTYVRYATAYRAGGASVRSTSFSPYEEEENQAFEVGMKSKWWNNRLSFNVAAYQTTIKNEQITVQEDPTNTPSLTNTINGPNRKIEGVETELSIVPVDNLNVGLNVAYMSTIDYQDIVNSIAFANSGGALSVVNRYFSVQTPKWTGSLFVDYSHDLHLGKLAAHVDYTYASSYYTTAGANLVSINGNNTVPSSIGPDFKRPTSEVRQMTARLSWKNIPVGVGEMEFALWGKNLTDRADSIFAFDGCAGGTGLCSYRAVPRTYGLEAKYGF